MEFCTETAHDFIKNQDGAMLFCFTAKCLQKPSTGRTHPIFPATGSTMTAAIPSPSSSIFLQKHQYRYKEQQPCLLPYLCDTRAVRTAESRCTRSGFHKEAVAMPMIAAGKFQYFISPCITAGSTKSTHRRFRSGRNKSYFSMDG